MSEQGRAVSEELPPRMRADVQRILDREARRLLAEGAYRDASGALAFPNRRAGDGSSDEGALSLEAEGMTEQRDIDMAVSVLAKELRQVTEHRDSLVEALENAPYPSDLAVSEGDRQEAERQRDDLLSAIKVWKNATESRCRLLSNRESSDSMLAPDWSC